MGVSVDAQETIFGHKIADMKTLWRAFGIDKYKLPKTNEGAGKEQKISVDEFKCEIEEYMPDFWEQFLTVYAEKYEDLKEHGVAGFIGTYNGMYEYGLWDDYVVILGQEINMEKMEIIDGRYDLHLTLPKNFDRIAHDFLAFNLKYGKQYVEACLVEEEFSEYAVVPEKEAQELVKKSGISISKKIGIHKFAAMG